MQTQMYHLFSHKIPTHSLIQLCIRAAAAVDAVQQFLGQSVLETAAESLSTLAAVSRVVVSCVCAVECPCFSVFNPCLLASAAPFACCAFLSLSFHAPTKTTRIYDDDVNETAFLSARRCLSLSLSFLLSSRPSYPSTHNKIHSLNLVSCELLTLELSRALTPAHYIDAHTILILMPPQESHATIQ